MVISSQSFIKGSAILIISVIIAKITGALFKIPITNMLGGEGMSCFGCAYGLFLPVYAVTVTGLSTAVAKLTAENIAFGKFNNAARIKKTALLLFSALGFFASLLTFLISKPFAVYIAQNFKAFYCIAAISPSVFFGCVMAVYRGSYEGMRNMYPTAVSQVIEGIVKLFAGLLLCGYALRNMDNIRHFFPEFMDDYSICAFFAVLGITLSSFAGMLFLIFRDLFSKNQFPKADTATDNSIQSRLSVSKQLLAILLPVSIGSLVTNLTSFIDLATIIRCIKSAAAANPFYFFSKYPFSANMQTDEFAEFVFGSFTGLAVTVFNLVPSITNMFAKGILPNITVAWSKSDRSALLGNSSDVLSAVAFIAVPCGFGMTILSAEILRFLYPLKTDEILISAESTACLGIGVIFLCLSFPVFSMLQGIGRADLPVKIMLAGVAVKLIANLILIPIPEINVCGAAIGTCLCYLIILILSLKAFSSISGVRPPYFKIFLPYIYASLLCCAAAALVNNLLSAITENRLSLIIAIVSGALIYFISLRLMNTKVKFR